MKYGIWSPPEGWVASGLAVRDLHMNEEDCGGGGLLSFIVKDINDAFKYQEFLYKYYEQRKYEFEVRER